MNFFSLAFLYAYMYISFDYLLCINIFFWRNQYAFVLMKYKDIVLTLKYLTIRFRNAFMYKGN